MVGCVRDNFVRDNVMAKCIMCSKEFAAKRADAKFCSGACSVKSSRQKINGILSNAVSDVKMETAIGTFTPSTEEITPYGEVKQVWDNEHPIPNLEGGYFHIGQTQQEYLGNIVERGYLFGGKKCTHEKEELVYMGRCLQCMATPEMIKEERKPLLKAVEKKKVKSER
jgi:hypothetical protein